MGRSSPEAAGAAGPPRSRRVGRSRVGDGDVGGGQPEISTRSNGGWDVKYEEEEEVNTGHGSGRRAEQGEAYSVCTLYYCVVWSSLPREVQNFRFGSRVVIIFSSLGTREQKPYL